jgi:hypothetical protein
LDFNTEGKKKQFFLAAEVSNPSLDAFARVDLGRANYYLIFEITLASYSHPTFDSLTSSLAVGRVGEFSCQTSPAGYTYGRVNPSVVTAGMTPII